jgi:hypothetical protein
MTRLLRWLLVRWRRRQIQREFYDIQQRRRLL